MRLRRERNLLQNNFPAQMSQNLVFIFCKILRFEQFCYCTLFATIIIIDKKIVFRISTFNINLKVIPL